jgi:hypothetical protein
MTEIKGLLAAARAAKRLANKAKRHLDKKVTSELRPLAEAVLREAAAEAAAAWQSLADAPKQTHGAAQ